MLGPEGPTDHNFTTEFPDETLNPLRSDIASKRISKKNALDTLKMKFRRLKLWKPTVAALAILGALHR